jgi:tetratricopeptide (TPR) repeat protein
MADVFSEAMAHHKAGRLDQAEELYRRILAANPEHADSLNLLGVVAHQKGDDRVSAELIERAIRIDSYRASYFVNLANAYRGLGRHDDAIKCCRTVLETQTDLVEARLALGISLAAKEQWADAERELRGVMEQRPQDSRGPQALANSYRAQGRGHEAIALYREALRRNPNDAAAHLGLGTVLVDDRNAAEAEAHLRRAVQMLPRQVTAWTNLGSCLIVLGREQEALEVLGQALKLSPEEPGIWTNLGQAWLSLGNRGSAENAFNAVLKLHPDHAAALHGLADVHREADRVEEAIPLYERALLIEPSAASYKGLAQALWERGDVARAVALLRESIARHPRDAENHVRLGTMLASGGDLCGAEAACRAALAIKPGNPPALIELALAQRGKLPEAELNALEGVLAIPSSAAARAAAHFGIAHVADGRGEFARAAEHLQLANSLKKAYNEPRGHGYDPARYSHYLDRMIATFDQSFFERTRGWGLDSERPVFVVGMPRSGTTLIEQILASHRKVYGAGERRFASQSLFRLTNEPRMPAEPLEAIAQLTPEQVRRCAGWHLDQLQKLDGGQAERVVDKMPDNYALLGWLATTFPKARFIHSRRDVRDVALSCWMTNFSGLHWADDLEHIAHRVKGYQRIMEHWRSMLPEPLFEIDYERLVADQEGESRRMVAWLGLEWDPACLNFHRAERLVKTASVTQVRQPMYSRSVGRWKHYEEALKSFLRALNA